MVPKTLITPGPKRAVPIPTPVGCEVEPVTDGIFNADKMKMNAPLKANSTLFLWILSHSFSDTE